MNSSCLVSTVVPCYKGERYVRSSINSLLEGMNVAIEVIIVDDASPDGCGGIADKMAQKDARITVIHHATNKGVAEAFNGGFDAASGKYLTRLAQDDLYKTGALEKMVDYLDSHPDADMVYSDMEYIDENGNVTGIFHAKSADDALKLGNGIGLCWMFRRKIWDAGFRFDPKFDQIEDFEFWMRVSRSFGIIKLDGPPLLQFRMHGSMGSAVHGAKMEVLSAKLIADYAECPKDASMALSEGYFNASFMLRKRGSRMKAIAYALQALRFQPFCWKHCRNLLASILCQ